MIRYRHHWLTYKQMRFCQYFSNFMTSTQAARCAGYSIHSARWQAYRLWSNLAVLLFYQWYMNLVTSGIEYLPMIDNKILENRLSKYGIKVYDLQLTVAMYKPLNIKLNEIDPTVRMLMEKYH